MAQRVQAGADRGRLFAIEAMDGGAVKLTVDHSIDVEGAKFVEAVSGGWPRIWSNLKSLLETGEVVARVK